MTKNQSHNTTLKQLRDELILQAHLFSLEMKNEWNELEAKWNQLQPILKTVTGAFDAHQKAKRESDVELQKNLEEAYKRLKVQLKSVH